MSHTIVKKVEMAEMVCGECGLDFTMPEWFRARMQETGATWYCPAGHRRVYRESDVAEARRLLADERLAREALADQLAAAQREAARAAKRVANGVCPCCHRSFVQLQRHMTNKHPEYVGAGS